MEPYLPFKLSIASSNAHAAVESELESLLKSEALFAQGYGRALWLMQGMFKCNGGCGCVRKPELLTGACSQVFDPKAKLPVKTTLKADVYMGDGWHLDFDKTDFDSYSPPDFYAKVGIAGVPADSMMKKTEIMDDNWTPVWDTEFWFPPTHSEVYAQLA